MTYKTDRRIANATIEFKNCDIDDTALKVIAECLEMIASELNMPPSHTKQKGAPLNGTNRKDKK